MKEPEAITKERTLELYTDLVRVFKEQQGETISVEELTVALIEKEIPKTMTEAVMLGTMIYHLFEGMKSMGMSKKEHYEMPKSN